MKKNSKRRAAVRRALENLGGELIRLRRTIALVSLFALLISGTEVFGVPGRVSEFVDRGGAGFGVAGDSIVEALEALPSMFGEVDERVESEEPVPVEQCEAFMPVSEAARITFFRQMPYGRLIREKSREYAVDPILVVAIIENESGFQRNAVSSRGARGLMQLMPETGEWMGAADLHDPEENIGAGVRYLRYLGERFEGDLALQLAAYNAGEGSVVRYGGIPPYRETRQYVDRVLKSYHRVADQLETFGRQFDARGGTPLVTPAG